MRYLQTLAQLGEKSLQLLFLTVVGSYRHWTVPFPRSLNKEDSHSDSLLPQPLPKALAIVSFVRHQLQELWSRLSSPVQYPHCLYGLAHQDALMRTRTLEIQPQRQAISLCYHYDFRPLPRLGNGNRLAPSFADAKHSSRKARLHSRLPCSSTSKAGRARQIRFHLSSFSHWRSFCQGVAEETYSQETSLPPTLYLQHIQDLAEFQKAKVATLPLLVGNLWLKRGIKNVQRTTHP